MAGVPDHEFFQYIGAIISFDDVEHAKKEEHKILRAKLEIQRIRLLSWGMVTKFSAGKTVVPDVALQDKSVLNKVAQLFGSIGQIFQNEQSLKSEFGLEKTKAIKKLFSSSPKHPFIFFNIFKDEYESMLNPETKRNPPWSIKDKYGFMDLVSTVQKIVDEVEATTPSCSGPSMTRIMEEIAKSQDIKQLQLLREASDTYEWMCSSAAKRIKELQGGPSAAASSSSKLAPLTNRMSRLSMMSPSSSRLAPPASSQDRTSVTSASSSIDPWGPNYETYRKEFINFRQAKDKGSVIVGLVGPTQYMTKVTSRCFWVDAQPPAEIINYQTVATNAQHPSFELYWKRQFSKAAPTDGRNIRSLEEDSILFDAECHKGYESVVPGAVTPSGFAAEAWYYEEDNFPKESKLYVSYAHPGGLTSAQLLRRMEELYRGADMLGANSRRDLLQLKEFGGDGGPGGYWVNPDDALKHSNQISSLFQVLGRDDMFVDFSTGTSVRLAWSGLEENRAIWNLLWQMILGKELGRRLELKDDDSYMTGMTANVMASLIIADLWCKNTRIELRTPKPFVHTRQVTHEMELQVGVHYKQAKAYMLNWDFEAAMDEYTKCLEIDRENVDLWIDRQSTLMEQKMWEEALTDAVMITYLNPNHVDGWNRLGIIHMELKQWKAAKKAFEKGLSFNQQALSLPLKFGVISADDEIAKAAKAIEAETDPEKKYNLQNALDEGECNNLGKTTIVLSLVHERQAEGLVQFAEKMGWPWVNEVREYAYTAYNNLLEGKADVNVNVQDWLSGLVLPGRYLSFTLMISLILSSKSLPTPEFTLKDTNKFGVTVSGRSYWRIRSSLGRVLGALPGVTSLCGWLGPCPPVEYLSGEAQSGVVKIVELKGNYVAPIVHPDWKANPNALWSHGDYKEDTDIGPGEDADAWRSEMLDEANWVIPQPPQRQNTSFELKAVQLQTEVSASATSSAGDVQYRPQLQIQQVGTNQLFTYKLFTIPTFVTLPPCYPHPQAGHAIHKRQFYRFDPKTFWNVEDLAKHTGEQNYATELTVINATGTGAELVARAWCAERGKNAVIRRSGGPCFTCAHMNAHRQLRTGALIWVE